MAKLTQAQQAEILAALAIEQPVARIAERLGVSRQCVYNVRDRAAGSPTGDRVQEVVQAAVETTAEDLICRIRGLAEPALAVFENAIDPASTPNSVKIKAAQTILGWIIPSADALAIAAQDNRPLSFGDSPEPEHQPGGQQLRIVDGNGANGSNGNGRATA